MCLILFAWEAHPRYRLVLAANRDEFHERPTARADYWDDYPDLLAGRDLQAGGTWLGISRAGRFAAITNYREPQAPESPLEHSRGHLVRDYIVDDAVPVEYAARVKRQGFAFRGFNLLLGDPHNLAYISNRADDPVLVSSGSHGLSNHLLDTDWPKVHSGRAQLETALRDDRVDPESLFDLLTDRTLTPGEMPADIHDSDLPEQLMRHYFITSPVYGTRSSTVLLLDRDGNVEFMERQFGPSGVATGTRRFDFRIQGHDNNDA